MLSGAVAVFCTSTKYCYGMERAGLSRVTSGLLHAGLTLVFHLTHTTMALATSTDGLTMPEHTIPNQSHTNNSVDS